MPIDRTATLSRERAFAICHDLLRAAGVELDAATVVADHVADCDLLGVTSHGLIRVPKYVDQLLEGYIRGDARIAVVADQPTMVRLDAGQGFGIVAMREAIRRAIIKSRETVVAVACVVNCAHTGRIGAFAEQAARENCFAMIFGGGSHRRYKEVAPYGGRRGVFDTNPYALAVPAGGHGPVIADFATAATAQGKMLVYRTSRRPVPDGWIIDAAGNPTTDAEDFYSGGAMLPSAGPKGYGLAMIAELIGDALLGEPHELNWMAIVIDLAAVRSLGDYETAAERFGDLVKACPPAPGFSEVMLPGEPERRTGEQRRREGIIVPVEARRLLNAAAQRVGLQPFFDA